MTETQTAANGCDPLIPGHVSIILKLVCTQSNFSLTEMCSPRRAAPLSLARQVAMYLCRHYTSRSLPEIGRRLGGRDHTTVLHGVRQIEARRQRDECLNHIVSSLEVSLENQGIPRLGLRP